MNKTATGMAVTATILAIVAFFQGGLPLVGRGFWIAGQTLLEVFPLLVMAFASAGLISILISKEMVTRWLGEEAGWKGPFLGSVMGTLVPGGPFFFYPLMATLIVSGASIGTMISFLAAKTLWNVARIPMEIVFVGVEITAIRFLITFAIPILAGIVLNTFLWGYGEKIKEEVRQLQVKNKAPKRGEQTD